MQTGSVLTLNFYSNPIDVMIGDDQTIYLNWKHYCDMISNDPEIAPHNIIRGEFDVDYVAFSYVVLHVDNLVYGHPDLLFANLVRDEFPGYIIKELGLIRELVPMIELDYETYSSGVFEHGGKHYFTEAAVKRLLGIDKVLVLADVPRYPAILSIELHSPRHYGMVLCNQAKNMMPVWMMDLDSLPYVLRTNREAKSERFLFDDHRDSMSYALKVSSPLGKQIANFDIEALGPKQHFNSPGVVGTHSCELDPEQIQEVQARDALLKSSRWEEPMTWAGSGLTLKSEL